MRHRTALFLAGLQAALLFALTACQDSHSMNVPVNPSRAYKDQRVIDLCIAAQRNDVRGIDKALAAGADVNASADQGSGEQITPIMFALVPDQPLALERLLAAGAKPNVLFPNKYSPMLIALSKTDPRFALLLLQAGADPNGETPFGREGSLLGRAIILSKEPVARRLLELGAKASGTYEDDPLLLNAIQWEELNYIPMLLEAGAPWTDKEMGAFCRYNKNNASDLDRSHPYWRNLQMAWDALAAHGIKVPCERIRQ